MNSGGLNPAQRRVMPGTLQAFHEDVVAGVSPAVEGGVPPPGPTPGRGWPARPFAGFAQLFTTGRDARFHGRQDARRYRNAATFFNPRAKNKSV